LNGGGRLIHVWLNRPQNDKIDAMKAYLNQLLLDAARRFVPFKDWIGEL